MRSRNRLSWCMSLLVSAWGFCCWLAVQAQEAPVGNPLNEPVDHPGVIPNGADGQPLNLNFETGTLRDWTATGKAFEQQPIQGEIDQKRIYGEGKKAEHTGQYWIGGFEKLLDAPRGTLTSAPFEVTQPFGSFLLGGGRAKTTRVELVLAETKQVFFTATGQDEEHLRPVIVDLKAQRGKQIFIRLVDDFDGGWGHINFDDFRFHPAKPKFRTPVINAVSAPQFAELYPNAGLDPQAAAQAMEVPPGFSVQLGAAEPDLLQPVAMAIDDRGRVWVAEAHTYPTRAPEGEGKDRVLIFEDTNLDGTLDKRTVFIEKLNLVTGLEVGFGGVYVGAAPYLLFIPDRDGDDQPDAEPEILLDGWGYHDTHETLNSFIWGPDGWLYGCHGVFTHSRVGAPGAPDDERTPLNAGVWRYHPIRKQFEVFAHGTSNPWGLDFNQHGDAFVTACVIPHLYHIIHGARYERQAGQHFNPHTYNDIKTIAKHRHYTGNQWNDDNRRQSDELGGGHAHAGAMIYLGGSWPARYTNQIFMNNIHGNRMNQDQLVAQGSGYYGDRAPDFLLTRDQWSQMLYMTYGPDGQVWCIDWYDRNQCHHGRTDGHDRSNGRLYRIAYDNTKPVPVNLKSHSDAELLILHAHPNEWYPRHARRILQERAAAGSLEVSTPAALRQATLSQSTPELTLRHLWTLHAINGLTPEVDQALLAHADPQVRAWMVKLTLDVPRVSKESPTVAIVAQLTELARVDPSPVVRLAITTVLPRLALSERWDILEALTRHPEDAHDHNLPLMYWYALEPLVHLDPQRTLALGLAAGEAIPLLKDYTIRRIGSGEPGKSLELLITGLAAAKDSALQLTFLRGLNEALRGQRMATAPAAWNDIARVVLSSENREVRQQALALAATFGNQRVLQALLATAGNDEQPIADRQHALSVLVKTQAPGTITVLKQSLATPELRSLSLRSLAEFDDPQVPEVILESYSSLTPTERRDALATLCSRPAFAKSLLEAIGKNQIPANHLTADLISQLRNLKDAALDELLAKSWGQVRETAADKVALLKQYQLLLNRPSRAAADLEHGRAIFARTCQQCHTLFGTGAKVGPDLTGSNRANLEYLLSNVVDPSAVMAKEYQPTIIVTTSGRVVTGLIKETRNDALVLQTANEDIIVPRDEIDEQSLSTKSMMPDDLLRPLTEAEVRNLVAYLASPGQVPLLAGPEQALQFFNGKDLSGWVGNADLWSVDNGEIIGKTEGLKENAFLVNQLSVEDFRLTLEVKLVNNAGNSGIQFRSQPLAGGDVKGYQADIGADWWGKLYEEHGRALLWDKSGEAHVKSGEWNTYEIVAVGSRIRTFINGQPCVDLEDPPGARRGIIALQLHSGGATEVRFRNLQLTLLSSVAQLANQKASPALQPGQSISFKKTTLDQKFRSEGVAYGDFNNDGLLDIAAGSVWYAAPDWTMQQVLDKANEFNIKTYGDTFCNWAEDLNGDGRQDLIVVDFPGKPTWWFENTGVNGGPWKRHQMFPVTNNESPNYLDVDGDGQRELLHGDGTQRMTLSRPGAAPELPWVGQRVSSPGDAAIAPFYHGLGMGDINLDGRNDIIVPNGWWEAPVMASADPWEFHPAPFGEAQANMFAFDFDGDGDQDVVGSSAHRRGIWWYEQTAPGEWTTHLIDDSIAQTHAMCHVDINGDGLPDLVTGKRYYAHNGRDPGEDEPAVLAWFELQRQDGKAVWTRHVIDEDSGVGTHFETVDLNRDGLLDVIVANKRGVFYFEQRR